VVDGWDCYVGSSMILDVASIHYARRRDWPYICAGRIATISTT
jgi:hypothetical protein